MTVVATEDSQVITMLCAPIGVGDAKPLTNAEWAKLAERLHASELGRPAALIGLSSGEIADGLTVGLPLAERIVRLLRRVARSRSSSSVSRRGASGS